MRSCQYGRTPYVEMAAVQVQCPSADAWLAEHEVPELVEEIEAEFRREQRSAADAPNTEVASVNVAARPGVANRAVNVAARPGVANRAAAMVRCHADIEWSWGRESLTLPADAHGPLGSRHVLFLASFPPEFSAPVPSSLRAEPPPFQPIEGRPGPANDPPTEAYPVPEPGVRLARRDQLPIGVPYAAWLTGGMVLAVAGGMAVVLVGSRRTGYHLDLL